MMRMKTYRYTECGLDNVFLEGVDVLQDDQGDEVYCIENILELHKMIAHAIISRHGGLSGPELRFLRTEMGLTQEELAKRLSCTRVTISRWERDEETMNLNAEVIVKLLAAEKMGIDRDMSSEDMALNSDWSTQGTTIRIDGSDPSHYRPIQEAAQSTNYR